MIFTALANKDKRKKMVRPAIIALSVIVGLTYAEHVATLIQEKHHEQNQINVMPQESVQAPQAW
jgi:hypothetical protein